jgi:hypothetical protein
MANELVRWSPGKVRPVERGTRPADRKIEEALALLGSGVEILAPGGRSPVILPRPSAVVTGPQVKIVDLPRFCSVDERAYAARYHEINGRYRLAQTFTVTEAMYQAQYSDQYDRRFAEVPCNDLGDEQCPWCGARSTYLGYPGPAHCATCKASVCYGRTVDNYFRCRKSCGGEGRLRPKGPPTETGIVLG